MRKIILVTLCGLILASCKQSRNEMITRKWQAVTVQSPELDKQIADSRVFFDTVGKSTPPEVNEQLYGARNMDSLRVILKMQLDSFLAMQANTVKETWLDFQENGTVATSFGAGIDTVKWYFDDEGNLMLDEMQQKGAGSKIMMRVEKLEPEELQLRFTENGFSSIAVFKPAGAK